MTFEGQAITTKPTREANEEKISKIFGSSTSGERKESATGKPKTTSRYIVASDYRTIAGIKVPHRPLEPDNCCMSGCVNCVWEIYNDELRHWQQRRRQATHALNDQQGSGTIWPADWDPPVASLALEHLPQELHKKKRAMEKEVAKSKQDVKQLFPQRSGPLPQSVIDAKRRHKAEKAQEEQEEQEGWSDVPIYVKVFAQFERSKKLQRQKEKMLRRQKKT